VAVNIVAPVRRRLSILRLQRLKASSTQHHCRTSFTATTRWQETSTRRYLDCLRMTSRTLHTCTAVAAAGWLWCRRLRATVCLRVLHVLPDNMSRRRLRSSRITYSDLP